MNGSKPGLRDELREQFAAAIHAEDAVEQLHVLVNRVGTEAKRQRRLLFGITGEQSKQNRPQPRWKRSDALFGSVCAHVSAHIGDIKTAEVFVENMQHLRIPHSEQGIVDLAMERQLQA